MATLEVRPQHMVALERANEIRLARAAMKGRIRAGTLRAAEVILDPPPQQENMTLLELLTSQVRWGERRASVLLGALGIPEMKTLGSLTERQRRELAGQL